MVDVIVIGAGPAGYIAAACARACVAASAARELNLKVIWQAHQAEAPLGFNPEDTTKKVREQR